MAAFILIATFVVVGLFVRWLRRQVQIASFKRKHGCQPEARLPQLERICGFGLYKELMHASNEKAVLKLCLKRYKDHGMLWSGKLMGKTYINTIDPENVKTILAEKFNDFGLGQRQQAFAALLGQGIFTTDGAQWEHSRALVRPNFSRAQVADLQYFEVHVKKLIAKIPKDNSAVDLQPLFFQLALDSSTEFLFGESVNSLTSKEGSANYRFERAFDFAQGRLPQRGRLGKYIHLYRDTEFKDACQEVHQFVDKIISNALEKTNSCGAEKSHQSSSQTERYVFLKEMMKSTQDPKKLRDELLNILLAGRDTTASLLSNTFHVLARRPDIWQKLTNEIATLQGAKPDYETLRNMKFLKNTLTESLRLFPVVPVNARFAKTDTVLPMGGGSDGTSPVFVPRGAVVAYHTYAMHRRKSIYGADAEEFRPERWNPEEGLRPGWAYLPFNGGPRICVGQLFALSHAAYVIVRLLQEFQGLVDRDGSEWLEQLSLTVCSAKGVLVSMVPRE